MTSFRQEAFSSTAGRLSKLSAGHPETRSTQHTSSNPSAMTTIRLNSIIPIAVTFTAIYFRLTDSTPLYAVPSQMSHEMAGTVHRIDRQTLTILLARESKPTVFAWNIKETKFVRDGVFANVEALRAGTHVTIRCSHPLFGPAPFLYWVSWQTGASHKNES